MGSARLDGRNGEIWKRVAIHGWTHERCAEHFELSKQRVDQIIGEVRRELKPIMAEELAQESLDTLKHVKAEALAVAEEARRGAPVFVGKDGDVAIDPETGEPVRDLTGYLRALETAAKMDEYMAKRFGLNAPDKREVEVKGTVRYEVAGVDVAGDLT